MEPAECPISEQICDQVLSLPIYPLLSALSVSAIVDGVNSFRP
jgi:hypothetical protein